MSKDILLFDTETTGLTMHPDAALALQPHCIEFGAILISGETGEAIEEWNWLINPGVPLPADIPRITGITDDMLLGEPRFAEFADRIRDIFARAGTVIAHNLPFDKSIMRYELLRLDAWPSFPWPAREICTVGLYASQWGRNPKMTELYEAVLGHPLAQTHRALDDVRALLEIVRAEEIWRI